MVYTIYVWSIHSRDYPIIVIKKEVSWEQLRIIDKMPTIVPIELV